MVNDHHVDDVYKVLLGMLDQEANKKKLLDFMDRMDTEKWPNLTKIREIVAYATMLAVWETRGMSEPFHVMCAYEPT